MRGWVNRGSEERMHPDSSKKRDIAKWVGLVELPTTQSNEIPGGIGQLRFIAKWISGRDPFSGSKYLSVLGSIANQIGDPWLGQQ
jgi:hypothetical protein